MGCPTLVACIDIRAVSDLEQNPTQILFVDTRTIGQLRCGDKRKPLYMEDLMATIRAFDRWYSGRREVVTST